MPKLFNRYIVTESLSSALSCIFVGFAVCFLYKYTDEQILVYMIRSDDEGIGQGIVVLKSIKVIFGICLCYVLYSLLVARLFPYLGLTDETNIRINIFSFNLIKDFLPKKQARQYFYSQADFISYSLYIYFSIAYIFGTLSECLPVASFRVIQLLYFIYALAYILFLTTIFFHIV